MIVRLAIAVSMLAVSGCATAEQPVPDRGGTAGGTCDESSIEDFLGLEHSPELEARILEASGAATVRWVPQGTMVTMEFRSDRVTAYLDASDQIERISCS